MRNLAPGIHRQRIVIEFTVSRRVIARDAGPLAHKLSRALGMNILDLDVSERCPLGLAVMCHWDYSGWSLMEWALPASGGSFASIDLHSCKPFAAETAVGVIRDHFGDWLGELEFEAVLPELASVAV